MRQEERRLLPHQRQQLVEVVRRGRAVARADPEGRGDRVQQAELRVVDQLPLLALLDAFHRQPHLLLELVVGTVEQVGHARMHAHHRLHRRQRVLPRRRRIVHERLWNLDVLREARDQVDVPLAVLVDRREQLEMLGHRLPEFLLQPGRRQDRVEILARQRQQRAGVIVRTVTSETRLVTSSISPKYSPSVSSADPQVAAMRALAEHLDLSLGDDEELVLLRALDDQVVPERHRLAPEALRHSVHDRLRQPREQRHAPQRLRGRRRPPRGPARSAPPAPVPPSCG